MKKPNLLLYLSLGLLLKVFAWFKGQRFISKVNLKGPAICLSNHTSFYDFIYTTTAIYPKRVSYLAASKMFYEPQTRPFLKLARAIPKSLMQADPAATLKAFRLLKKKSIISIFPEGQISPSGKTLKPAYSIAKFLKKADVDVYIIKHYGAGFVNPPWTKKTFRGKIETEVKLWISKEDLASLSLDQIYEKILLGLDFKPSNFIREKGYSYKTNHIKGLENVIYQCPKCLREGLVASHNVLKCPICEHELHMNHQGLLENEAIDVWFDQQEMRVRKEIDQTDHFELRGSSRLLSFRNERLVEVGKGIIYLTEKHYTYKGTVDGIEKTLVFDVKNTPTLPSDIGRNIQIYEGYQIFQFELSIPWLATKFVHAGEYFFEKINADAKYQ